MAATPKIKPKIETVPSSIPNTMVPAELTSEVRRRCQVAAIVTVGSLKTGACHAPGTGGESWNTTLCYCDAVAAFASEASAPVNALTAAAASGPSPCRFASQLGSL